jgi:hypothetical protein
MIPTIIIGMMNSWSRKPADGGSICGSGLSSRFGFEGAFSEVDMLVRLGSGKANP